MLIIVIFKLFLHPDKVFPNISHLYSAVETLHPEEIISWD